MNYFKKVYFAVVLVINVAAKNYATTTCGSEVYSIYHTQLNVPCYDDQDIDDLPIMDLKTIKNDSIFFIEASCKGGLNIRQACSVEAAAVVNPRRQVYVFFAGVVNRQCVRADPLASLLSYKNVRLYRIHPENFAFDCGLDHLLRSVIVNQSPYPVQYALDVLKFVVLYKFGGVYMDMDMLATRPLDELPYGDNWVPIFDHELGALSAGILSVSNDAVGRKLAESILSVLKEPRALDLASHDVIKEGVQKFCGVVPFNETKNGLSFTCRGLVLYDSKFFIPIPCESSGKYFSSDLDFENLTRSFTQHLCNGLTYDKTITRQSTYALLMSQYCPKVYSFFDRMGFKEQGEFIEGVDSMRIGNNLIAKERLTKTDGNANTTDSTRNEKRKWIYDIFSNTTDSNGLCDEVRVES